MTFDYFVNITNAGRDAIIVEAESRQDLCPIGEETLS